MTSFYWENATSNKDYARLLWNIGGWRLLLAKIVDGVIWRWWALVSRFVSREKTFRFGNQTYEYCNVKYNLSWINERSVEVPIGSWLVRRFKSGTVLTVGAVLKHYMKPDWEILDKYELGAGIINEDVLDFKPSQKYDLILSISTLEHIGLDEEDVDEFKAVKTVEHLRTCLADGGLLVATVPLGYNQVLDRHLFSSSKAGFDTVRFLKRVSVANEWEEVVPAGVTGVMYGWPFNNGNAIAIGIIGKDPFGE